MSSSSHSLSPLIDHLFLSCSAFPYSIAARSEDAMETNTQTTAVSPSSLAPPSMTVGPISAKTFKPFRHRYGRCLLVSLNIFFVLVGQTSGTLLSRFYFDKQGNSKWLATFIQTAGFPLLLPIVLLLPANSSTSTTTTTGTTSTTILIYLGLGLLMAGYDMLYSYGVAFLPVSTYSLLCSTQLAFNSIFSFFLNSQKFTVPIFNSVVLLIFSSVLLAVRSDSERPAGVSSAQYAIGFGSTLAASIFFSLSLSLMQLSFQKHFKRMTFSVALKMQVCTSVVATAACLVGLFASGDWRKLSGELHSFKTGKVSYVMTMVGTGIAWQVGSLGIIGLTLTVSSLFSNVISTVGLPIVPVLAIFVFQDKMDGVKLMALLLSLWGFASYVYQQYLDSGKKSTSGFAFERTEERNNCVDC